MLLTPVALLVGFLLLKPDPKVVKRGNGPSRVGFGWVLVGYGFLLLVWGSSLLRL